MKAIVYTNELGGAAVAGLSADVSEQDALQALSAIHFDAQLMNIDALPKDNDFFDAWVLQNNQVTVAIDRARDLTKQRMRRQRQPLLLELDVAFQRALETNSDTIEIVAQKQKLRDLTKLVDSAQTLDDLRQALNLIKQGI
jgi:hypothetical protein